MHINYAFIDTVHHIIIIAIHLLCKISLYVGSIIGQSATLTISPAVVINASYVLIRNSINLFCLDGKNFYYDAEWLNPSFQLISSKCILMITSIIMWKNFEGEKFWCIGGLWKPLKF